jgi:translocation protein SEC63
MANYHYDEAGNMATYFLISFLTVVLIPLTFSLSPTSGTCFAFRRNSPLIPTGKASRPQMDVNANHASTTEKRCASKNTELSSDQNSAPGMPCLSAVCITHDRRRTILTITGWVVLAVVGLKAAQAKVDNKIYNPFEILGIRTVSDMDVNGRLATFYVTPVCCWTACAQYPS